MAKRDPVAEAWGLEELDPESRRLKRFDFGGLQAYPVFTTYAAALAFAGTLTENATGGDAERFRRMTRKCVRRINPREIPRASWVAVNATAFRNPEDDAASLMMLWGTFCDERAAAERN